MAVKLDVSVFPDRFMPDLWSIEDPEDRMEATVRLFMDMTFYAALDEMADSEMYSDTKISTARWLNRMRRKHL